VDVRSVVVSEAATTIHGCSRAEVVDALAWAQQRLSGTILALASGELRIAEVESDEAAGVTSPARNDFIVVLGPRAMT